MNLPCAVNFKLGLIISGTTFANTCYQPAFLVNNIQISTNELVENFWVLDLVPEIKNNMSDKQYIKHFQNTHFYEETRHYIV